MKKKNTMIVSLAVFMAAGGAHASAFYINPKIAWSQTRVDESRTELKSIKGTWTEFDGNKHESWSAHGNKLSPIFAVGYDFDTQKYGTFGIEAQYGQATNHFDPTDSTLDFDGNMPNDSDTRDFKYSEQTLALNAKYGYKLNRFMPFVTIGVGYTIINSENNFRSGTYWWETRDEERNMSWNIGAGAEIPVTHAIALTMEYRYTDLGNVKYTNRMYHENAAKNNNGIERHFDSNVELKKHEVMAGVKISF